MSGLIYKSIGFEKLSVAQTSVSLTQAIYKNAIRAVISIEGANIRTRLDGAAPTTDTGILWQSGTNITLESSYEIRCFNAISVTGTAVLNIEYFI